MTHDMRLGIVATALVLLGTGCATHEWTEGLFAKRQAEIDDRFIKVETGALERGHRIDRLERRMTNLETVEGRVADLETRVTATRDPAARAPRGAGVRSENGAPDEPRLVRGPGPRPSHTLVSVVHVLFAFDRAELDLGAKTALASVARELHDNPKMTIELEGTTDRTGQVQYNVRLSLRRAESVKRWLVASGVESTRILHLTGRGPLADPRVTDEEKRRVTVKLMGSVP